MIALQHVLLPHSASSTLFISYLFTFFKLLRTLTVFRNAVLFSATYVALWHRINCICAGLCASYVSSFIHEVHSLPFADDV